jgi:hypothetical protein
MLQEIFRLKSLKAVLERENYLRIFVRKGIFLTLKLV